jgi:RNA polymerase sigma-70 factor (ECF subfamily)
MLDRLMAHYRHLERILRRRGRSREDAEDLIQETFLRVKKYLDEGKEIREPEAFLVRIALNLSRDAHQHEHRHLYATKPIEDYVLRDPGGTPIELLEAEDRLKRLSRALNHAGKHAKEIFLMHRVHGMSYLQIADHFGISQSAVEKQMARAWAAIGDAANEDES